MLTRRQFFTSAASGTGIIMATSILGVARSDESGKKQNEEVSANEDLMREHGVLRRALLVYALSAPKVRNSPGAVPPDAIRKTALLFRQFGEDYHERRLEEPFIFPAIKKKNSQLSPLVDTLLAQHQRGREITDYVLAQSSGQKLPTSSQLPDVLDAFVLMYQQHTAREDTIIFPAWHEMLSEKEYDHLGDKFEDIERQQFGHDGFEDAVKQISEIEATLGFSDLAQFTAPPAPAFAKPL